MTGSDGPDDEFVYVSSKGVKVEIEAESFGSDACYLCEGEIHLEDKTSYFHAKVLEGRGTAEDADAMRYQNVVICVDCFFVFFR